MSEQDTSNFPLEKLSLASTEPPEVEEGRQAAREGSGWGACPYTDNEAKREAWAYGHLTESETLSLQALPGGRAA